MRKKAPALLLALLCAVLLCSCNAKSEVSDHSPSEETTSEDVLSEEAVPGESGPEEIRSEESKTAPFEEDSSRKGQTTEESPSSADLTDTEEHSEIVTGEINTVEITHLSSADADAFHGKEMEADPDYLEKTPSSDVFRIQAPVSRIEVHPIAKWAMDYSAYTISDEILGTVAALSAEEPFKIYDIFPEGIPLNCAVYFLEDGSCGTFSLGFSGSGEEYSYENPIYQNYASLQATREEKVEEGSVNGILDLYRRLADEAESDGWPVENVCSRMQSAGIPLFGASFTNEDGETACAASGSHFLEASLDLYRSMGTARLDLNHDGTPELLLGYRPSEGDDSENPTTLFAAYSVKGGNVQTIFHGWSRCSYQIRQDGAIIRMGSSGAMNYDIIHYDLVEDEDGSLSLQEAEALVCDASADEENPFICYPRGREILDYDEYGSPIYADAEMEPMNQENGRAYQEQLIGQPIHIDLEPVEDNPKG